jgi:hypothetical protein
MTDKTRRVPVMPVPVQDPVFIGNLVRDDGSPMNAGSSNGIPPSMMPVCAKKSLDSGANSVPNFVFGLTKPAFFS